MTSEPELGENRGNLFNNFGASQLLQYRFTQFDGVHSRHTVTKYYQDNVIWFRKQGCVRPDNLVQPPADPGPYHCRFMHLAANDHGGTIRSPPWIQQIFDSKNLAADRLAATVNVPERVVSVKSLGAANHL
jgi:hypothetical protein